jgi:hypothetical protein
VPTLRCRITNNTRTAWLVVLTLGLFVAGTGIAAAQPLLVGPPFFADRVPEPYPVPEFIQKLVCGRFSLP